MANTSSYHNIGTPKDAGRCKRCNGAEAAGLYRARIFAHGFKTKRKEDDQYEAYKVVEGMNGKPVLFSQWISVGMNLLTSDLPKEMNPF